LMITNKIILSEQYPSPLSINSIARIPRGVEAEPIPSIFADRFILINSQASSLSPLNTFLMIGRNILASQLLIPVSCMTLITDIHTAYIASNLTASPSDPLTPLSMLDSTISGEVAISRQMLAVVMIKNNVFILTVYDSECRYRIYAEEENASSVRVAC